MRAAGCLSIALLGLTGCGYPGNPLPPELAIPVAIQDLRGVQRGDSILLAFTPIAKSTGGVTLQSLAEIELRAGVNLSGPFEINRWAADAKRIPVPGTGLEPRDVAVPAAEWAGKDVIIAVRAIGPKGRPSNWSNLLVQTVVKPLARPAALKAEGVAEGIFLTWTQPEKAAEAHWRVWRAVEGEANPTVLGTAPDLSWMDPNAVYGKSYTYTVQQVLQAGDREAESELSERVRATYADTFPPAVPSGLAAIAGIQSAELNWDRNKEQDLKGYLIYRAEGDGEMKQIGDLLSRSNYSDAKVESGKKYRYAVAAVDLLGNTSAKSGAVEIVAP